MSPSLDGPYGDHTIIWYARGAPANRTALVHVSHFVSSFLRRFFGPKKEKLCRGLGLEVFELQAVGRGARFSAGFRAWVPEHELSTSL